MVVVVVVVGVRRAARAAHPFRLSRARTTPRLPKDASVLPLSARFSPAPSVCYHLFEVLSVPYPARNLRQCRKQPFRRTISTLLQVRAPRSSPITSRTDTTAARRFLPHTDGNTRNLRKGRATPTVCKVDFPRAQVAEYIAECARVLEKTGLKVKV